MKIRKLILNTLFCCAITLLSMFVTVSAYARDNSDYIDSAAEEYVAENGITYQVINDSFSAKGEIKNYIVRVDYSSFDTAAICLVRTGKSDAEMTVTDSSGNKVASLTSNSTYARSWKFVDKPAGTVYEDYTIMVKSTTYNATQNSFRICIGNKADVETMLSGKENAVWLNRYTESSRNMFMTHYTPNTGESWYRFTAGGDTVFTLMSHHPQVRFKVCEAKDINNIVYRSIDVENAHKSKFCLSYGYAEKDKITLKSGTDYYMVIYTPNAINGGEFIDDTMNLCVGKAAMAPGSVTVYSGTGIYVRQSDYSVPVDIKVGDNGNKIPLTAVAESVSLKTTTSGIRLSMIGGWRVKAQDINAWRTSTSSRSSIDMGYVKDSTGNHNINGTWQISAKASSSSFSFVPGMTIYYYYEIGD